MRQAIDEQAEVVDQRINLLSHEVHESVKDSEIATDQLRQMIQENREAARRSHAASEDEILKDLDKLEGRMFSVEKSVGMRTPAGEWNLNPAAQSPDRATSSGANASFRELNLKLFLNTRSLLSGPPNLLVVLMKNKSFLLIECRGCKVGGGPRRSLDPQGLIPRRTGVRTGSLMTSEGRSAISLRIVIKRA